MQEAQRNVIFSGKLYRNLRKENIISTRYLINPENKQRQWNVITRL